METKHKLFIFDHRRYYADYSFYCGDTALKISEKYKYLGLLLTEHLDYNITAKMVAQAASRALGLVIAKDKAHGGMPFDCFTKLYDSVVQSVINYGAAVWGTKEFSCISAVQNRACRYFMGLGKYAPNIALQGDTGWHHPIYHQWMCVSNLWCRMVNMSNNRLNKRVFVWSCNLSQKNWASRTRNFFRDRHLAHLCEIDQYLVVDQVKHEMREALSAYVLSIWNHKLQRVEAQRGQGRNKLRTYRLFKNDLQTEPYLKMIYYRSHRSALAKFRCGVVALSIETGRYTGVAEENRTCFNCNDEVENEEHVLINCDLYADLRTNLFDNAVNISANFMGLTSTEKLCFPLSDPDICIYTAKTLKTILDRRRQILYQ